MQDWKTRHQTAGLENARLEKAAPNCRGGKCETGKRGTKTAGVENTGKAGMDSQMLLYTLMLFKSDTRSGKYEKNVMLLSSVN